MDPRTSIYDKAAQLQKKVARRLDIIKEKKSEIRENVKSEIPSRPMPRLHRKPPPARPVQVRRAIQLVRDRDKIRDAFVASVILGPPKALEEKS